MEKEQKREWFKTWWGILVALAFLPIFACWWVWAKSSWQAKTKKRVLIPLGTFVVLLYILFGVGIVAVKGMPTIDAVKSPTSQEAIKITGHGTEANAQVKLSLNGKEMQTVQADGSGNFAFDSIVLSEGDNIIKAIAILKDGKNKESVEKKIVYQKPQPTVAEQPTQTEETKTDPTTQPAAEESKQEETITEQPAPTVVEKPKEKTTMDKLWDALDQSVKTRDGFSIEYFGKYFDNSTVERRDNNLVQLSIAPKDYMDETALVKIGYQQFVQYGLKAFQIDQVDEIEFIYWNNFTDQYGKSSKEKALDLSMTKTEFSKYEWGNLVGKNIYQQMLASCTTHYIYPAVMKNVKIDKLTLLSI